MQTHWVQGKRDDGRPPEDGSAAVTVVQRQAACGQLRCAGTSLRVHMPRLLAKASSRAPLGVLTSSHSLVPHTPAGRGEQAWQQGATRRC